MKASMSRAIRARHLRIAPGTWAPLGFGFAVALACTSADKEQGASPLRCDDSLKTSFKPDADTAVTFVKAFSAGDPLALSDTPAMPAPPTATTDLCMIKLNVGPGNPGPAAAPSTSPGIGVELWVPLAKHWNGRVHVLGGGGWAGGTAISSTTQVGALAAAAVAGSEGAVSAQTDTGHTVGSGSFAVDPDGSINTALWKDFAERGIHEMALAAKSLAKGFYGREAKYSYWDGCSTGGRQGLKEAQAHPDDFDGILAFAPAINWTTFITDELYPQVVFQRDLGGAPLTTDQVRLVSSKAVSACDSTVTGQHDGYVSDAASCQYDPVADQSVLCVADGGSNSTASCLTAAQAKAVDKIWYGQTVDGSVPTAALDNGFHPLLAPSQIWFGVTRGSAIGGDLASGGDFGLASSRGGMPSPFPIATDQVALNLQDTSVATPAFKNASKDGADGWKSLSFAQLAQASADGVTLQPQFADINTDNPDLGGFRARGGKLILGHGLADQLIPPQGTLNYYERVSSLLGGAAEAQQFLRFFEVPGMAHCAGNGSAAGVSGVSPAPNPPLPAQGQLYGVLTQWVESDQAPEVIVVSTADGTTSRPLCLYPGKLVYVSGDRSAAASYACQ